MGTRQIITNKGLELLAASSSFAGQSFWLGYYALAYVPNFWKIDPPDTIDFPNSPSSEVNAGFGGVEIQPTDNVYEVINSAMTRLTKNGDMIWNVFQGDLTGSGFIDGLSNSPGGDLFGLTLYSANVKKHYRYLIDENGNNNLLGWIIDPINPSLMKQAHRYRGTDGFVSSTMPIPAPLYYFGDASKDNRQGPFDVSFYLNDFLNNTGADLYPSLVIEVTPGGPANEHDIPRISADYRGYLDSTGNSNNSPVTPDPFFDVDPLASDPSKLDDVTAWYDANSTHLGLSNDFLNKFYMLLSVSNYNRYHAPVGSDGNILNSDLKNRNMAKVSKLFPIFDFSVLNSQRGFSSDGQQREVATGLTLSIDLDLKPSAKTSGFVDGVYNQESDLTLQNRYNNPANTDPIFNRTTTSFKFNRLGIYAVPLRKAPNTQDPLLTGADIRFEVEIDPDAEPVLFAVVDWDNSVTLSDAGDGAHQFKAQINVNLESPDGVNETPLVRDSAVFFNLYNDSSINWYKNQLLANASIQHAVIEMQQQIASIRERNNRDSSCCGPTSSSSSSQQTTQGLRNILDSNTKEDGGLKSINSFVEGGILPENGLLYSLGDSATALGRGNAASQDSSFAIGLNNHITVNESGFVASSIVGGSGNVIKKANNAGIFSAELSTIDDSANHSVILGGKNHNVQSGILQAAILGGEGLIASGENQVVMGKFNNANVDADVMVGSGSDDFSRDNSFEFLTFKSGSATGKRSIKISNIATEANLSALSSGDIYRDTSDGNRLKIKP